MPTSNLILTLIPTSEDFQIIDVFMDGIIAPDDLQSLQLPDGIDWEKGIVIDGRGTGWVYSHLVGRCLSAPWVVVNSAVDGFVVVKSNQGVTPRVGEVIPDERLEPYRLRHPDAEKPAASDQKIGAKLIAFIGPPHSGKGVLLNAIRLGLRGMLHSEDFQRRFYILRACPDGEGDWFSEIPPEQAKTLRYKNRFDEEFVDRIVEHLRRLKKQKRLLLVDCGGKIDKKNQRIWNLCTHAIIVSSDPAKIPEWRGAATTSELTVVAEIESVLEDKIQIVRDAPPLRLILGKLERGNTTLPLPDLLLNHIVSGTLDAKPQRIRG